MIAVGAVLHLELPVAVIDVGGIPPQHLDAAGRPIDAPGGDAVSEEALCMNSEVFYGTTPAGDYCKIWDVEHEELPEFVGVPLDHVNQAGIFGDTPLHVAAMRGDLDEVAALLDGGAEVNARGELGDTALHLAVGQNRDIVKSCGTGLSDQAAFSFRPVVFSLSRS